MQHHISGWMEPIDVRGSEGNLKMIGLAVISCRHHMKTLPMFGH